MAQPAPSDKNDEPLGPAFLREYARTRGFMLGRPVRPKPTPDGKAVLFLRSGPTDPRQSLFEFDVATGRTRELLTPQQVLKGAEEKLSPEEKARRERMRVTAGGFANYQLSEDGSLVLLSLSGKLYVLDRKTEKVRELKTGPGTILDPKFSPDGKMVGYVKDHDVYAYDLATDEEWAVTTGGTPERTHGLAEFVAQEEMGRLSGYWWSPDATHIAYEEADASGVEVWYVADPYNPDRPPRKQFYPRPGKANVKVRLGIVPVKGGETVWVDWDREKHEYLAAVRWDERGPLTIQVQDRKQQELVLLLVDPETGRTSPLLTERDSAFVNLRQDVPVWLPGGDAFLWITETDAATVLQRRSRSGGTAQTIAEAGMIQDLTLGPEPGMARFVSLTPAGPSHHHTVSNLLDGEVRVDAALASTGVGSCAFAKKSWTRVCTATSFDRLPQTWVYGSRGPGSPVELPSVARDPGFRPNVRVEQLGGEHGVWTAVVKPGRSVPMGNAWTQSGGGLRGNYLPPKGTRYPVILDVYGGPRHLSVRPAMRDWLLPQWLADQGFIVVAVDNRGTPGRGRAWERPIYQNFGSVPLDDQVRGLKLLAEKHPEMDLDRVGIVGWSFGGYMSALAVLKRPDVFKAAVAGAPVTDWEDYDTHYTERYLGLLPESRWAYDQASLIPLAGKLERPLLLVHGTADDNVYFRHTLKLTDALFRAGKDFEVLPLPSLTHMVPDPVVTERLWTRVARHFEEHLGEPAAK